MIAGDAERLLELSRQVQGKLPDGSDERRQIVAAADLLGQLLLQDVERTGDGVGLRDGVSKDWTLPGHDPEMRHGCKSSHRRFDWDKAAAVVDTGTPLITAADELPGNSPGNLGALELVEQSETSVACRCWRLWATPPMETGIPGWPSSMRNVTRTIRKSGWCADHTGRTHQLGGFRFDAAVCGACALRPV